MGLILPTPHSAEMALASSTLHSEAETPKIQSVCLSAAEKLRFDMHDRMGGPRMQSVALTRAAILRSRCLATARLAA
jgi:hypothetical protein